MKNKLNVKQELEIIEKKKNGITLKKIMLEYNIKQAKTIYDVIERNGREKLIANKRYTINENYFENIDTEEKAYWLGFLYADGYVRMKYERSGELKLKLAIKDKEHIELFKKCLDSTHPIKDVNSKVIVDGREYKSLCSAFSVYNTKLVQDLYKIGCVNVKTFLITIPNIDSELIRHFIRGYFDGDGCIHLTKNSNGATCSIISNEIFINGIKNILGYGNIRKCDNIYVISFGAKENILYFYHLLYDNSTIYLKRKKDLFDKLFTNSYYSKKI